jgi:hypothetical protein
VVHPQQPGLFFMGFFNVSGGGNIRMMDDQAQWVARLVNGLCGLPTVADMNHAIDQERHTIQQLYPNSPRYGLELDPMDYRRQLARVQRIPARP